MTYELAKELHDAGWPLSDEQKSAIAHAEAVSGAILDNQLPIPTLNELIEVIEYADLFLLSRLNVETGQKEWTVFVPGTVSGLWFATPEEAVALLWIALNRPEKS